MIKFKVELKISKNLLEELEKLSERENKTRDEIIAKVLRIGLVVEKSSLESLKPEIWRII